MAGEVKRQMKSSSRPGATLMGSAAAGAELIDRHQADPPGVQRGLRAAPDAELPQDAAHVGLDGLLGDGAVARSPDRHPGLPPHQATVRASPGLATERAPRATDAPAPRTKGGIMARPLPVAARSGGSQAGYKDIQATRGAGRCTSWRPALGGALWLQRYPIMHPARCPPTG